MRRFLAALMSVALVLAHANAAFAASETLEMPFGGPPPRAACQAAALACDDSSLQTNEAVDEPRGLMRLVVLLRHRPLVRRPAQADEVQPGPRNWGFLGRQRQQGDSRGQAEGGGSAGPRGTDGAPRGTDGGGRGPRGDSGSDGPRGVADPGGR